MRGETVSYVVFAAHLPLYMLPYSTSLRMLSWLAMIVINCVKIGDVFNCLVILLSIQCTVLNMYVYRALLSLMIL